MPSSGSATSLSASRTWSGVGIVSSTSWTTSRPDRLRISISRRNEEVDHRKSKAARELHGKLVQREGRERSDCSSDDSGSRLLFLRRGAPDLRSSANRLRNSDVIENETCPAEVLSPLIPPESAPAAITGPP